MIKILFVCHGNICRSPMAEYIFKHLLEQMNLQKYSFVASAATSSEEIYNGIGNPIYPPAQEVLTSLGIGMTEYTDFSRKRATQVKKSDYDKFDYFLCADRMNIKNLKRIVGEDYDHKIYLLLDFSDDLIYKGKEVADPWYTGNFEATKIDLVVGCQAFLKKMVELGQLPS